MMKNWALRWSPITSSNGLYSGYVKTLEHNLIDGDSETMGYMSSGAWLQLEYPIKVTPMFLYVESSHQSDGWETNNPQFYVELSNDSVTWETHLNVTHISGMGGPGKFAKLFIEKPVPSRYIKYTNVGGQVCTANINFLVIDCPAEIGSPAYCWMKVGFLVHFSIIFLLLK